MFKKIIEYFYPFTDNQEDFVLKNKPTWYSQDYRYILYSGNKGKTFRRVRKAIPPLFTLGSNVLEYDWTFERMTFRPDDHPFDYYRQQFKSVKDVQDFENQEYQRYLKGKERVKQARVEYIERYNKNIQ